MVRYFFLLEDHILIIWSSQRPLFLSPRGYSHTSFAQKCERLIRYLGYPLTRNMRRYTQKLRPNTPNSTSLTTGNSSDSTLVILLLLTHCSSRNLSTWAKNGVLMLNTCLTVRQGDSNSHTDKGWEKFTDYVIRMVDEYGGANLSSPDAPGGTGFGRGVVFLAWGAQAAKRVVGLDQVIFSFPFSFDFPSRSNFSFCILFRKNT
jgi:hypothetical protein